jgi:hypothetical protein
MLTANADSGSAFGGWSGGGCSGTGGCNVDLTAGQTVTATFNPSQLCATVSVSTLAAGFDQLQLVAVDTGGEVYAADAIPSVARVLPDGSKSTVVSGGQWKYTYGLAFDGTYMYAAVAGTSCRLQRVRMSDLSVDTLAGNGTCASSDGTGGATGTAEFKGALRLAYNGNGVLYAADVTGYRVRKILTSDGTTTTLSGNGTSGYHDGTGGPTGTTKFTVPWAVAVANGTIYVSDVTRVRAVTASTGATTTFAGPTGLTDVLGIVSDGADNLYVADYSSNKILKVDAGGIITSLAGTGTAGFHDDSSGCQATFNRPSALALYGKELFVADTTNNAIRVITLP